MRSSLACLVPARMWSHACHCKVLDGGDRYLNREREREGGRERERERETERKRQTEREIYIYSYIYMGRPYSCSSRCTLFSCGFLPELPSMISLERYILYINVFFRLHCYSHSNFKSRHSTHLERQSSVSILVQTHVELSHVIRYHPT